MPSYDLIPRQVPTVWTKYRRIVTEIPAPGSLAELKKLHQERYEKK